MDTTAGNRIGQQLRVGYNYTRNQARLHGIYHDGILTANFTENGDKIAITEDPIARKLTKLVLEPTGGTNLHVYEWEKDGSLEFTLTTTHKGKIPGAVHLSADSNGNGKFVSTKNKPE